MVPGVISNRFFVSVNWSAPPAPKTKSGIFENADSLNSIIYGIGEIQAESEHEAATISEKESSAARRLAKKGIASFLQMESHDIRIIRNKVTGLSTVDVKGQVKNMDISLSHDGRFAAFAFLAD